MLRGNDKHLIVPKLLYFWLNTSVYASYTFTTAFLIDKWRISLHQYSFISSLCAFSFFGSLFWTMLADRYNKHKEILMLTCSLYAVSYCLLIDRLPIARFFLEPTTSESTRLLYVAIVYSLSSFFMSAMYPLLDEQMLRVILAQNRKSSVCAVTGTMVISKELYGRQRLWGTVGQGIVTVVNGVAIDAMGYNSIFVTVSVSTCIFVLVVLYGVPSRSVSIAAAFELASEVPSSSNLLERGSDAGQDKSSLKSPSGSSNGIVALADATPSVAWKGDDDAILQEHGGGSLGPSRLGVSFSDGKNPDNASLHGSEAAAAVRHGTTRASSLRAFMRPLLLLYTTEFIFFLFLMLVAGYTRSVAGNFVPIFLKGVMKQSQQTIGFIMLCRIGPEIAIFFYGKRLHTQLGTSGMLIMGQASGTLRVLGYAILPSTPGWGNAAFVIELLKGANNACVVSAGVRLANDLAPQDAAATAQGLFSGIYGNLSMAIAGIIGGIMLNTESEDPSEQIHGLRHLFWSTTLVSGAALLLYCAKIFLSTVKTRGAAN